MELTLFPIAPCPRPDPIRLERFPAILGRNPAVALHIDDRWVSRHHCQVDLEGAVPVVRDLGSKHGTFVNGRRVEEARLCCGDKLTVGMSSFTVDYEGSSTRAAAVGHHAASGGGR